MSCINTAKSIVADLIGMYGSSKELSSIVNELNSIASEVTDEEKQAAKERLEELNKKNERKSSSNNSIDDTNKVRPVFDTLPFYKDGQRTMTYAGIGSRETPIEVLAKMDRVAARLQSLGYTLQSGGAIGADMAFEGKSHPISLRAGNKDVLNKKGKVVLKANEEVHIGSKEFTDAYYVFTSKDNNGQIVSTRTVNLTKRMKARSFNPWTSRANDGKVQQIAAEIHPRGMALNESALKLMSRNTYQVFGENLDTPVDFVLAWTPNNKNNEIVTSHSKRDDTTGGTGQAISMASLKGIPVINMADPNWESQLNVIISSKEKSNTEHSKDFSGVYKYTKDNKEYTLELTMNAEGIYNISVNGKQVNPRSQYEVRKIIEDKGAVKQDINTTPTTGMVQSEASTVVLPAPPSRKAKFNNADIDSIYVTQGYSENRNTSTNNLQRIVEDNSYYVQIAYSIFDENTLKKDGNGYVQVDSSTPTTNLKEAIKCNKGSSCTLNSKDAVRLYNGTKQYIQSGKSTDLELDKKILRNLAEVVREDRKDVDHTLQINDTVVQVTYSDRSGDRLKGALARSNSTNGTIVIAKELSNADVLKYVDDMSSPTSVQKSVITTLTDSIFTERLGQEYKSFRSVLNKLAEEGEGRLAKFVLMHEVGHIYNKDTQLNYFDKEGQETFDVLTEIRALDLLNNGSRKYLSDNPILRELRANMFAFANINSSNKEVQVFIKEAEKVLVTVDDVINGITPIDSLLYSNSRYQDNSFYSGFDDIYDNYDMAQNSFADYDEGYYNLFDDSINPNTASTIEAVLQECNG